MWLMCDRKRKTENSMPCCGALFCCTTHKRIPFFICSSPFSFSFRRFFSLFLFVRECVTFAVVVRFASKHHVALKSNLHLFFSCVCDFFSFSPKEREKRICCSVAVKSYTTRIPNKSRFIEPNRERDLSK